MTKPAEKTDFTSLFREVFINQIPKELRSECSILNRAIIKDPIKQIQQPVFKNRKAPLPKVKKWINMEMIAGILKTEKVPGGTTCSVKQNQMDGSEY